MPLSGTNICRLRDFLVELHVNDTHHWATHSVVSPAVRYYIRAGQQRLTNEPQQKMYASLFNKVWYDDERIHAYAPVSSMKAPGTSPRAKTSNAGRRWIRTGRRQVKRKYADPAYTATPSGGSYCNDDFYGDEKAGILYYAIRGCNTHR